MFHAPSTQSLLCFESSARLRSFTAAAHELHLTQGAVSRQIKMLEERLGVALFVRRRDAMTLTDAGREYIAEIEPLLKRLERATVIAACQEAMEEEREGAIARGNSANSTTLASQCVTAFFDSLW